MFHSFYEVVDDMEHPTSWWLDEVRCQNRDFDGRELTIGRRIKNSGTLTVVTKKPGEPMDFSFSLLFVPVVTSQVADLIDRLAPGAVQRLPIELDGVKGRYEVLNVVQVLDAVDRERSGYILWKPEDGRPDKVGSFRQVLPMVIRPDIQQNVGIFRPLGWTSPLVISAQLKNALDRMNARGVLYRPLEGGFTAN